MKYIKHVFLITILSLTSYTASAKDGDFMGKVSFDNAKMNNVSLQRYRVNRSIDKSHSGVLIKQKLVMLTFQQKLLSAADK
ncbi:hypothetical protein AYY19_07695 [Photobacterium aquimaris]|uniref:hypothetical protein n=1 Tax=Photobacterium TaxID=657 RepID=UPI0007EF7324|nr:MULTISPECIES: hypothetical protein [Photobacterium]OBU12794.1 hypothetical protein AYY19_07695 [Photobacterium aquimaris]PSW00823.1 hypothetical protein CTM91_11225 [Photobacterium aquimaris]